MVFLFSFTSYTESLKLTSFSPVPWYLCEFHLFTFTFSPFPLIPLPSSPLFLRRHVAIPASGRNISCVATQEKAALSKGISCLTSQLPGQADSNAGTTIAFRPKMLYLCIVNETHWWGSLPDRIPRNCMEGGCPIQKLDYSLKRKEWRKWKRKLGRRFCKSSWLYSLHSVLHSELRAACSARIFHDIELDRNWINH